jgi:hypothetical protein
MDRGLPPLSLNRWYTKTINVQLRCLHSEGPLPSKETPKNNRRHHTIVKVILAMPGAVLAEIPDAFAGRFIGKKIDPLTRFVLRKRRPDNSASVST